MCDSVPRQIDLWRGAFIFYGCITWGQFVEKSRLWAGFCGILRGLTEGLEICYNVGSSITIPAQVTHSSHTIAYKRVTGQVRFNPFSP